MSDLPPAMLHERALTPMEEVRCVSQASEIFGVSPLLIQAIIRVEGGKIGTISPNKNGTYDLGIMQLNTANLRTIRKAYPRVTWRHLVYQPCTNIAVGTWWLRREIDHAGGDVWKGVGNYHSRTPKYHHRYVEKVKRAYRRIVKAVQRQFVLAARGIR